MHATFDFHFNYIKWIAKSVKKCRKKIILYLSSCLQKDQVPLEMLGFQ